MENQFHIKIEYYGQIAEADCKVELGRNLYLTMTSPYKGIKTEVFVLDKDGNRRQFYNRQEAEEEASKELWSLMEQIKSVQQYRSEYTEAANHFQKRYSQLLSEFTATDASRQRGWLTRQAEVTHQAFGEYVEMVRKLVPYRNIFGLVSPDLVVQILSVI